MFSLLYPNGEKSKNDLCGDIAFSEYNAEQLRFYELLELTSCNAGDFFTSDRETIEYRQEAFKDMEENPSLIGVFSGMLPYLSDITELRQIGDTSLVCGEDYLYTLSEIELFVSLLEYIKSELLPFGEKLKSRAFVTLLEKTDALCNGEYFYTLTEKLKSLSSRVRDIKSITLGINLDSAMNVEGAGVLSVNADKFKSGDFFEKIKRLDFKSDDMTFISRLIPFKKDDNDTRRLSLINAVNNAITDVFKSSLKEWKEAVGAYVLENTDFLISLMPEAEFLIKGYGLIKKLREKNINLVYPEITDNGTLYARGIVNPLIALITKDEPVKNDIEFDDSAKIYVITGPNRGGKSVLTCAVGLSVAMAQLGLPVCADGFSLSPADIILTHFPTGSDDTVEKGRLGEECRRLEEIFDKVTENSLVLLDEALSSTGSFEGSYIASEVLEGFSLSGCRCIFSTHLHDLAASVDKINERCIKKGGVKIDNLVAEVSEGKRSFRIVRKAPDGKSYAKDIAEKYGLSAEKIENKILSRKK